MWSAFASASVVGSGGQGAGPVAERLSTGCRAALAASYWARQRCRSAMEARMHPGVDAAGRVWCRSTRTAACPSAESDVGGEPFGLGGDDPGLSEGFADDGGAVGPVLGQGLAGPLAGDQDAAAAEAEVLPVVRLRVAPAGSQAGAGVLGLDAVAEPVRAARRARQAPQLGVQPVDVRSRPGSSVGGRRRCRRSTWSGT